MRQAQDGDRHAYAELLVLLTSVARRFVRTRLGHASWADDVVQETLITVHRARHTYDVSRPFAPWFYAIARSRLIDVLRRERRLGARELGVDELPEVVSADRSDREAEVDATAIRQALETLPARQREVVEALKLSDQSVREVASRLGMSESAVKVTAHRGYRALRRLLGGRTHED
jgi:RNA polymerase sigma-70 factor (ECF subfamily)